MTAIPASALPAYVFGATLSNCDDASKEPMYVSPMTSSALYPHPRAGPNFEKLRSVLLDSQTYGESSFFSSPEWGLGMSPIAATPTSQEKYIFDELPYIGFTI